MFRAHIVKVGAAGNQLVLFPEMLMQMNLPGLFKFMHRQRSYRLRKYKRFLSGSHLDTTLASITPVNVLSTSEAYHDIALLIFLMILIAISLHLFLQFIPNFNNVTLKLRR